MKKITKRTVICLALAAFLALGTGVFVIKFAVSGGDWASFPSNRHLYINGALKSGTVADRYGYVLAEGSDGQWQFADSWTMRRATLHAVGDAQGKIGVGALNRFSDKLTGYNIVTGAKPLFSVLICRFSKSKSDRWYCSSWGVTLK